MENKFNIKHLSELNSIPKSFFLVLRSAKNCPGSMVRAVCCFLLRCQLHIRIIFLHGLGARNRVALGIDSLSAQADIGVFRYQ